jgi:hypothetical protein
MVGCGDGPSNFNAELTRRGGHIVSVDPLYAFGAPQIKQRIAATYPTIIQQVQANQDDFVWDTISSVERLGQIRMAAMEAFLADYENGQKKGRYLPESLPTLSFAGRQFDLGLCSHFLFIYSAHFTAEFHLCSILEMLRVADEARIFPLLALDGASSPHLNFVIEALSDSGFVVEISRVQYEFQRGGNQLLTVKRPMR